MSRLPSAPFKVASSHRQWRYAGHPVCIRSPRTFHSCSSHCRRRWGIFSQGDLASRQERSRQLSTSSYQRTLTARQKVWFHLNPRRDYRGISRKRVSKRLPLRHWKCSQLTQIQSHSKKGHFSWRIRNPYKALLDRERQAMAVFTDRECSNKYARKSKRSFLPRWRLSRLPLRPGSIRLPAWTMSLISSLFNWW